MFNITKKSVKLAYINYRHFSGVLNGNYGIKIKPYLKSIGCVRNYNGRKEDCFSVRKPLDAQKFKPASFVIFDLDGTVVDSEAFTVEAHKQFLAKYKKKFSYDLQEKIVGTGDIDAARTITYALDLDMKPEVYAHGVWQIQRELFTKSKLKPGAKDLVCHFVNSKVPVALATCSGKKSFQFKTRDIQTQRLMKAFCHIVLGGEDPEIKKRNPDPDLFLVTASRFPQSPKDMSQVLVIDDSPLGVAAAKAAGMQVVMVPDKRMQWKTTDKADLVIEQLNELKPELFSLPKAKFY